MSNPAYEKYIESLEKAYDLLKKTDIISPDENRYEGGRNTNGASHGFGKMIYADGNIYEGNWLNGKRSEKGRLTLTTGTIYEGEWADDKRNGHGEITYGESSSFGHGNVYNGGWKDDEKHGEGIFSNDSNQSKLTQIWENGILVDAYGDGVLSIEEFSVLCYEEDKYYRTEYNMIYSGEIKNNIPNGQGTIQFDGDFESDCKYIGNWKNGAFDGYGELSYNDYVYEGEWKEGKYHGQGKLIFNNESDSKYIGNWKDGLRNGLGSQTSNFMSYEGEWKEDEYHGQGIYKDEFEESEGEFRKGSLWNGYQNYPTLFVGTIRNGERSHGRVFNHYPDTFEWVEGDFSNDKIIGKAKGKLKNGKIVDVNGDGNGGITYKNQ